MQLNDFSALEPKLKKQKETPSNEPESSDTESDDLNEENSEKEKEKEKLSDPNYILLYLHLTIDLLLH